MDDECAVWTDDDEKMPVGGNIKKLFNDLYKQLNLARGKISVTTGDMQKKWIAQRIELNKNIIDLAKSHQVRVVPRWSVKDIKANVNTILKKGLSHIDNLNKLASGMEIYIVNGGSMQIATVEMQDGVLGFNIMGRWIKADSADDFLIFTIN